MRAKRKQQLIPAVEEDIEELEWVDKKKIPEKLQNSYANIAEIIEKMKKKNVWNFCLAAATLLAQHSMVL